MYTVNVPATNDLGSYTTKAKDRADALWQYNRERAHDGLSPLRRMPKGTTYSKPARQSAWSKGVALYAEELRELLEENNLPATKENLLNGAKDWSEYSYGGCSLIYDADIAERLCSPSKLKKTKGGELPPNSLESWLDAQARALYQAARIVLRQSN